MRRLLLAGLVLAFAAGTSSVAATPCRDANGKFVKCASVKPHKCRDAKGKFTACPAGPGKSG